MTHPLKPFIKWFGYTRRERRSSFLLLIIIILIIAIRTVIPDSRMSIQDISDSLAISPGLIADKNKMPDSTLFFSFDPNTAPSEILISLGLSAKQTGTLINYRNKGGKFRKPSDILKIYGIDTVLGIRLMPYIVIDNRTLNKKSNNNYRNTIIDLNSCDSSDLEKLPGIGPVLSSRIIKYRNLLGGYYAVSQIREVYGLSDSTYNKISGMITADSTELNSIDINKAGYRELIRHPYLERYDVQSILRYREQKGEINSGTELVTAKILPEKRYLKILPYLDFK